MAKKLGGTRKRQVVQDASLFDTPSAQRDTDSPKERENQERDSSGEGPSMDSPDGSVIDVRRVGPCPTCNGLSFWWNCKDERRCQRCDPPLVQGGRLIADAAMCRSNADKSRRSAKSATVSP